jgi:hypothetical protein
MGDTPLFGVWEFELVLRCMGLSGSLIVVSTEFFLDLDPIKLFFCLNFSSQLALRTFWLPSGLPQVVAKKCAFSLIIVSVKG